MTKTKKEVKETKDQKLGKTLKNSEGKSPEKKKQKPKKGKSKVKEVVDAELVKPATNLTLSEMAAKQKAGQKSKKAKNDKNPSSDQKPEQKPTKDAQDQAKQEKKDKKKNKKKLQKQTDKEDKIKSPVNPGQTVFVGNVPSNTKHVQLMKLFAPFGKVLSVRFRTANGKVIFKHKMRKESAALTAYVVLDSVEAATKALELNGSLLKEHHLRVQKAENEQKTSNPKCTVFVGNLKATCTDDSLHQIFSSCGEIEYVRTLRAGDQKDACNGTAFVCFKSPEAVGLALELEGTMLDNRPIHVERYTPAKLGGKEKRLAENKNGFDKKNKNKKGPQKGAKGKGPNKAPGNKEQGGTKADEKKKKSEFRGVKSTGMKKKPKKKLPGEMKRLANKIAPKE